jgi:O-antigen ligase
MKFSSINKSKIFNWSILLFSLFPILPNKIKGLPVILLLITSLFFFKRKNIMWWRFFLNSSLYFLFLFSFFITENIGLEAKFRLETTLSILVIPVIFYILIPSVKFQKKLLNNFIRVFIFSSIVFMLIVFLYIILDRDTIYYSSWFANKARTLIVEVPYIGQHPIYASIFSSISLIFIIKLFRDNKNKSLLKGILTTLGILSQSLFLILIISKAVVISLLVSLVFYFFTLIKSKRQKFFIIAIFLILLSSLLIFNRRMNELIRNETYSQVNLNYSNSLRLQIYKCGLQLIKNNYVFGYGIGNTQYKLNECYSESNQYKMINIYNSHNQYIDIVLKTGIIGLIVFLAFLSENIYYAKRTNNRLLLTIILFYCINFFTENILLRQSGVIMFVFLLAFLNKFNFKEASNKLIEEV